jgi:hypothetical protein
MTDAGVGPLSAEEVKIREAADQAYRVLNGEETPAGRPADQLLHVLRMRAREAPLQSLAIAFILGVMVARRR